MVSIIAIYSILIICLHTVKWIQVLLFNINHSIECNSFIYSQMVPNIAMLYQYFKFSHVKNFKYCYLILKVLFNITHSFAHLNGSKYFYVSLTIQLNICGLKSNIASDHRGKEKKEECEFVDSLYASRGNLHTRRRGYKKTKLVRQRRVILRAENRH